MLDALNQIQGEPSHRNLSWLPRFFPDHVRVIASSLAGPALDTLRMRDWATHPLPLAAAAERGRMIDTFLELYHKTLSPPLRERIVHAPGAASPLFLRTVLEELRQFGDFDRLPDQIGKYLEATTPVELFRQVIRRWQTDFHGDRDVANRSLRHLWAARQGLAESEWLELLADERGPMDRQTWRPLFLAVATNLVQRSGLWALGHDYLRQAIEIELLPAVDAQKQAHLAVADYFENHPGQREMTARKAAEWPHQLHAAAAWERLEACLTDIPLFLALYNARTKWELTGYWHPLRKNGRDMGACYTTANARWASDPANGGDHHYVPAQLGAFLLDIGLYSPAEPLLERALEASERVLGAEHPQTLVSVNNLAFLLSRKGDYAGAQPLYERALEGLLKISQAIRRPHPNLHACVGNYSGCLEKLRRSPEQIRSALAELAARYGMSLGGADAETRKAPSAKLRPVLEEIMRDQSRLPEIAGRLRGEDPELFKELVAFIQSQQGGGNATEEATREQRLTVQRQTAGRLIQEGRYAEAGGILEQLLAAGFEIPGTHIHLARVCLLTGRAAEAREHAGQAWAHRSDAPPYTVARILWLQLLGALQNRESPSPILGKLKHLLRSGAATMEWTMDPVLAQVKPGLDPESHALLTILVAAMSDPQKISALEQFALWRDVEPQPLD